MNDTNPTRVLGWQLDCHGDRITRAMAGLVLAELPLAASEHRTDAITALISRGAVDLCRTYELNATEYAIPIIGHLLDHISSYFPELYPPRAASLPSMPPGCDPDKAWIASRLDDLDPLTKCSLLRRISNDYEPVDSAARDQVERQIARDQRLFATIHGSVYRALRYVGGRDDTARCADSEAWRTITIDDLVKAIMIDVRAGLSPVFSDIVVREGLAFIDRHKD